MKAFLVTVLVSATLSAVGVKVATPDPRAGWDLVPVVVVAVDVPAGTVVSMEMISQRSLPHQFLTAAQVVPNDASRVVNQRATVAMFAGEPLMWSAFADVTERWVVEACALAIKPTVDEASAGEKKEAAAREAARWVELQREEKETP